jgi:hypothetical protein
VPLLFAVTLFVSASLLFMVQPMVGKLVLPLLGGSPAVWNACMVFFQALLLLGYLYADRLTRLPDTRKQWYIHLGVMSMPIAVFVLAVMFGSRGTPIAVAESLAPTEGSSAILSVLTILTVAIGVPFFVCSTSATLLQKWFTYTGHPSARDPYFLYAASNLGSLISLLGYPIFIEPNMTQGAQTWFWSVGFLVLFGLIAFCGHAAVNPLGVPPTATKGGSKQTAGPAVTGGEKGTAPPAGEPPPSWLRMAKWTLLAFVPSSLMLGVTFHMTTDIASIPLLWVGPLALYLVTFIIAFGKTPTGFRVLIGNLAPVMILLLVFLMLSEVKPGTGLELLLYNLTFFAAAMMCHYELARDRPSPQYLTTYFLIMSFGGVLGGIFNSLLAPIIFTQSYEFPLALIIACFMVPKLIPGEDEDGAGAKPAASTATTSKTNGRILWGWVQDEDDKWPVLIGSGVMGVLGMVGALPAYKWFTGLLSIVVGVIVYNLVYMFLWKRIWPRYRALPEQTRNGMAIALDIIIPVALGVLFYYMPRILGGSQWYANWSAGIKEATPEAISLSRNTLNIVVLYAVPVMICFFFVDRPVRFALCVAALLIPTKVREGSGRDIVHTERSFFGILKIEKNEYEFKPDFLTLDGQPAPGGSIEYYRLVHGTTLHGTQAKKLVNHSRDLLQMLTINPWDNIAVTGAITHFDMKQEPLTYYHRTGPVGAMFRELRTRKGGADSHAHVAMVGLGTGSASCYALKGQKLTFYEIDPAVKKLVADTDEYFTFVKDAERRGAEIDFKMGDARLKLKEDTDRKYALLLVDAFSSDSIPVHLLTVEAVGLYLERMTDDGILALHISNKYVKLEPVVAAIAEKHNLVARVWNDEAEKLPGKTASSWVALARKREDLGERICNPLSDLMSDYGAGAQLIEVIKRAYPELREQLERPTSAAKPREVVLSFLDKRIGDPQALRFAALIRKYGSEYDTLMAFLQAETGYGFRPLRLMRDLPVWTDDYADVMRVMMIKELQAVRKFFQLPTLDDD